MTRARVGKVYQFMPTFGLLGFLVGILWLAAGIIPSNAQTAIVDSVAPAATYRVYLPLVVRDDPMRTQRLCRYGVGAPSDIARYPVNQLRVGWYTNWGAAQQPAQPGGIEYLQMIRLSQSGRDSYSSTPQGDGLLAIVNAHPGSYWVIGNEPDRRKWQDSLEPAIYARAYHDLYDQIKAADPTARIVAGSIVQPTPIRLQYLDMVLDSYRALYGQQMPVDVWNIHAFILNERSCTFFPDDCWGADVPPGINAPEGNRYRIEDNASIEIFKQFVVDFRQWMADRGYRERPLIITEYGVLMPEDYGFPPSRVNAYMNATFDYLSTAVGATGYSADKGRLVQAWAWYSLADRNFNGWLYDPQSTARTVYGDNFVAYTAGLAPAVNLTPVQLRAEPITGSQPGQTRRLVAQVANNGNVAMARPAQVRFYAGDPAHGGTVIGSTQVLPVLNGCGNATEVAVTWANPPAGASAVWVVVDPLNETAESDEADNQLMATVSVGA
jgi:hypothetical protein